MKEKIKEIIIKSLEELNEELENNKIVISDNTVIFGGESELDSLDFVNLTCTIEDMIFDDMDKSITILSEKAFSKSKSPFRDITTLTEFVLELLEGEE